MQTILGSGGAIGVHLARELKKYTPSVRLVSRKPSCVEGDEELISADLTNPEAADKSVAGSEVVYLTVGLPYDHKIWEKAWPAIMENVIRACKQHRSKLVFFDNNYMYDPDHLNAMTEGTPIHPTSKKGKIRARIGRRLMSVAEKGEIDALIARSADFYGPSSGDTSILSELVFKPFSQGKKANWMLADDKLHSYTYTPDAAKATALLGNTESAYGQIWHMPTASDPPTGQEWIEMIANQMNCKSRYRVVSSFTLSLMGVFNKNIQELKELCYQYEKDYVFDSTKFEREFNIKPTSYKKGVRETVDADYNHV